MFVLVGTFRIKESELIQRLVPEAIQIGYRLIDTAQVYQNHEVIGKELKRLPLSTFLNVFVTTKISPTNMGDSTLSSLKDTLKELNLIRVDLCLLHWPGSAKTPSTSPQNRLNRLVSWKALVQAYHLGFVRAIGVSNFTLAHMENLKEDWTLEAEREGSGEGDGGESWISPMVNQIELHPWIGMTFKEEEIWRLKWNCWLQGYSPFGEGALLRDEISFPSLFGLSHLSSKVRKERKASILIRWSIQRGFGVIPKSTSLINLASNWESYRESIPLTDEEMNSLNDCGFHHPVKFCWDPKGIA